ncbi:MAG: orotidine-5'-phosphate decarboxylase, partial [Chitinophagales bacterium]
MVFSKEQLLIYLFDIGILRFGEFKLRSGMISPFYLDFRKVVGYPELLKALCVKLWEQVRGKGFDHICGVPYAGVAFAAGISVHNGVPMILKRKERKKHGTKNLLEGVFQTGDTCIVIEDVVSSGISLLETLGELKAEGLHVKEAVIIVDRQQGGVQVLESQGYKIHSLFNMQEVADILLKAGKIDQTIHDATLKFVSDTKVDVDSVITQLQKEQGETPSIDIPTYAERIDTAQHPTTKRLLGIIEEKQSNLICSADVNTKADLLKLADDVGPHICALKTHIDIINDFDFDLIDQLKALSKKHNFLLFEDRKFADIGNTMKLQYLSEGYNIWEWADMITVHVVAGASGIQALKDTGKLGDTGLVIIAQMSTKDTLTSLDYLRQAVQIGEVHQDAVMGFVAQKRTSDNLGLLQFTPGVNLKSKGDSSGQTYNSPAVAFGERGADLIIVG